LETGKSLENLVNGKLRKNGEITQALELEGIKNRLKVLRKS